MTPSLGAVDAWTSGAVLNVSMSGLLTASAGGSFGELVINNKPDSRCSRSRVVDPTRGSSSDLSVRATCRHAKQADCPPGLSVVRMLGFPVKSKRAGTAGDRAGLVVHA